ncbi:transposase [Microcystis viridis]|uniref:transposase n=1 Tax=Microcystis viridis TaxID=44822 RepID=UPI00030884FE|nr:transposase [Microcystis viridis]
MKPLYRKTLLRFLPIVFNLERANQLSLLPDKDLADFCPLIEPYQVTKNQIFNGCCWSSPFYLHYCCS